MTSSISILSTTTIDSAPSIILTSPKDGTKTLVNCGEGCQRSFLESPHRIKQINRVCFTSTEVDGIGGIGGMVLTSADGYEEGCGEMEIMGPKGTFDFLHSLRFFVKRDKFILKVREAEKDDGFYPMRQIGGGGNGREKNRNGNGEKKGNKNKKKKKRGDRNNERSVHGGFEARPIVCRYSENIEKNGNNNASKRQRSDDDSDPKTEVISYLFHTPKIPGKLLVEKARELGIPPGPLYAKLKAGKTVTFKKKRDDSEEEEEVTVESHQVVMEPSPGIGVAVIYCPNLEVLQQLQSSSVLFLEKKEVTMDCMVHMAPSGLVHSKEYKTWMETFGEEVQHVILYSRPSSASILHASFSEDGSNSPFYAAMKGALKRSYLHPQIFPPPLLSSPPIPESASKETAIESLPNAVTAKPGMEYILMPRSKQQIDTSALRPTTIDTERPKHLNEVQAIEESQSIITSSTEKESTSPAEILFTGTGAALPCKHRNVTGMYLRFSNSNSILLDCGEGTTGQLLRSWQSRFASNEKEMMERLKGIKAIWISHPHADHHLGLLRLLTERYRYCLEDGADDPVVVLAPFCIFAFLKECAHLHPLIKRSYIPLDCRTLLPHKDYRTTNPFYKKLNDDLGITSCQALPVQHCRDAYALVLESEFLPYGRKLVYSGDCRPNYRLATQEGHNADLLIHEATFENGMEMEAHLKRHCTVGEALRVAQDMNAKFVILTHFSQRYPKIPPLESSSEMKKEEVIDENQEKKFLLNGEIVTATEKDEKITNESAEFLPLPPPNNEETKQETNASPENIPVIFSFDFMTLQPHTLDMASKLTPALRLLYPGITEEEEEEDDALTTMNGVKKASAAEILNVPGVFAKSELL